LAPILRGKSWLRELAISARVLTPTARPSSSGGDLDADGLFINAVSRQAIERVNLFELPTPTAPMFVATHGAPSESIALQWASDSQRITSRPFLGFERLFEDTFSNEAPAATFDAVRNWLLEKFRSHSPVAVYPTASATRHLVLDDCTETACEMDGGQRGVLAQPQVPSLADRQRVVLFCNTSNEPRSGIGAFATSTARALARAGIASLRFDFLGVGDSDASPEGSTHVYGTPRHADFETATEFLKGLGYERYVLVGVCSGGFHGLNNGPDIEGIETIVAINTLNYVWDASDVRADKHRSSHTYMRLALSVSTWKRALLGQVDIATVIGALARRMKDRYWPSERRSAINLFRNKLFRFLEDGGDVLMLLGKDDASLDRLESAFGPYGEQLTRCGATIIVDDQIDHGLALKSSRQRITDRIVEHLASSHARAANLVA